MHVVPSACRILQANCKPSTVPCPPIQTLSAVQHSKRPAFVTRCCFALQALAKIAVRSGEPYRLQCYSILAAAGNAGAGGSDALGLGSAIRPALALLDRMYAAQVGGAAAWAAPLPGRRQRTLWGAARLAAAGQAGCRPCLLGVS